MRLSITLKVFGALFLCVGAAAAVLVGLAEHSYRANVSSVVDQALVNAQRSFRNVQASESSKLGATLSALMADERMRELYEKRDREALLEYAQPLYAELKSRYAVTNWHFMDVQPEMFVFLRMHDPGNHSEVFWHQTAANAIREKSTVSGMELGKFGFALRVVGPYKNRDQAVIGYMEVAEDIARFAETMKAQTGDDYALVAKKSLLDSNAYETSATRRKERNAWNDFRDVLVLGATTPNAALVKFEGRDLATVPTSGQFLEEIHDSDKVSVRGVFPLLDVNQKVIGGVFVDHDISPLYKALAAQRTNALLTIGVLLLVLGLALAMILRTLVFRRLDATMHAATRVVGGDFETPIVMTSDDEVGRLEALLESFRQVFVTTVSDYEQQLATRSERHARGVSGTGPVASAEDAESEQSAATR